MSVQEPRQSENALNDLFEQEARQSHGQYTHIEPEADDLGASTPRSGYSRPTADDERGLTVEDVYTGDQLSVWDDPPVKETPYGEGVMLSVVNDPEDVLWITSTVAWDLDEME